MSRQHKGHHERGVAAVEMALVLPILIALVFGIIDFSRAFNAELQLSQAAREGARLAAIGEPTYTPALATTRAEDAAPNPAFGQGGLTVTKVQMCTADSGTDDTGTVTVTFDYNPIFWPTAIDMSQTAVMRCGG